MNQTHKIAIISVIMILGGISAACGRADAGAKNGEVAGESRNFKNPGSAPAPQSGEFGRSRWEVGNSGSSHGDNSGPRSSDAGTDARSSHGDGREVPTPAAGRGPGIPVLCYHQTFHGSNTFSGFNVAPDVFEEQLRWLKQEGYTTISMTQFAAAMSGQVPADFPKKPILLTFDDGLLSNYTVVQSILRRHGMKGVLFIYPTIISAKRKNYMDWHHLKKLAASPEFEIGSHTYYHPRLPDMSRKNIREQLRRSKEILEEQLGVSVISLAYPFGLYDTRVIEEAREAGYKVAFTVHPGKNRPGDNLYTLNRYMVVHRQSIGTFARFVEMESPRAVAISPADGSHVTQGEQLRLNIGDIDKGTLKVSLNGKLLDVNGGGDEVRATLRFPSKRGYLPLTVRGTTADGRKVFRQFLYLNRSKLKSANL